MNRRPGVLVLAAAGILAVGLLIGVVLGGGGGDTPEAAAPAVTGSAGTEPEPPTTTRPTATGQEPLAVDVSDVEMYDYLGGLRLPRSRSAGPRTMDDHLASGFAHSPLGALLAAVNITFRTSGPLGAPVFRPTIEDQVVGVDKPDLLAATLREGSPTLIGPDEQFADSRLAGWVLESYGPEEAAMRYLLTRVDTNGETVAAAVRIELRWVDDDWRVVAPPGGDWSTVGGRENNPSLYHPFTV